MPYVKQLNRAQLLAHVDQSHSLWSGGRSVAERCERIGGWMDRLGPKVFFMSGWVDDEGRLQASLKRYYFDLNLQGRTAGCVGLGGIFTDVGARRQGHAKTLIETVLEESRREQGCSLASLYSDIGARYYQQFGFRETPARSWKIATASLPQSPALAARARSAADSQALRSWYERTVSPCPLYTIRDETTWALFHALNSVDRTLILSRQGKEVGYLSFSPKTERFLWLDEWAVPDASSDEIWSTVRSVAQEAGADEVRGWELPLVGPEGRETIDRSKALPMVAVLGPGAEALPPELLEKAYFSPSDHF